MEIVAGLFVAGLCIAVMLLAANIAVFILEKTVPATPPETNPSDLASGLLTISILFSLAAIAYFLQFTSSNGEMFVAVLSAMATGLLLVSVLGSGAWLLRKRQESELLGNPKHSKPTARQLGISREDDTFGAFISDPPLPKKSPMSVVLFSFAALALVFVLVMWLQTR